MLQSSAKSPNHTFEPAAVGGCGVYRGMGKLCLGLMCFIPSFVDFILSWLQLS
jgi:hypothetical protein